MKVICAWCEQLIGYKCDHCGEPLTAAQIQTGQTLRNAMICASGMTPIVYENPEQGQTTHGICHQCRAAFAEFGLDKQWTEEEAEPEKRGPTGVHTAPTNTRTDEKKKDGAA